MANTSQILKCYTLSILDIPEANFLSKPGNENFVPFFEILLRGTIIILAKI